MREGSEKKQIHIRLLQLKKSRVEIINKQNKYNKQHIYKRRPI